MKSVWSQPPPSSLRDDPTMGEHTVEAHNSLSHYSLVNIPKESKTDYSVLTTESGEQKILSIHSTSSF